MFKFELIENEQPVALYRQSEVVLIKPVFWVLVAIYLPWFFVIQYDIYQTYDFWILAWTLLVLLYAVNKYLIWLVNVYVVTNRRLLRFGYKTLLQKTVLETPLERIQNVGFKTTGLVSSLFDFGDVEVQAAGLPEPLVLHRVRHPAKVKDFLWAAHRKQSIS